MARKAEGPQRSRTMLLVGVGTVAVALAGVLIWISTQGAAPAKSAAVKSDAELGAVRNVLGSATAKTTVVEYGDFQ